MLHKAIKLVLIALMLITTMLPRYPAYAEDKDNKEQATTEKESDKESEEDGEKLTGDNEDTKASTTGNIGINRETAETVGKEVHKLLVDIGGTGKPISTQFKGDGKKDENTKLYNEIIKAQLLLYELMYESGIDSKLESPVTATKLEEDTSFAKLRHYLTAYNIINDFLKQQVKTLESIEGSDKLLIEALNLAILDMSKVKADTITEATPLATEEIKTMLQNNLNKSTAQSLNIYMKYMNAGNGSDDIKELKAAANIDATKSLLSLIKQWDALPHIKDATDAMKISGITNVNQEWLTALQEIIDTMESDNDGSTDPDSVKGGGDTNPELATSALGRMGSSLFTVKRAAGADNDPNKPITNTLGWVLDENIKARNQESDPGPAAKDDFLAMFAATAMYTPFISKIGDKDYVEAFKALFNEGPEPLRDDDERVVFEGNALGPLDILNQVQNLKKPLYYTEKLDSLGKATVYGYSNEDVKGVTQLLTVGDLIETIKNKKDLAAVTMNGVFEKDGDAWSFYNYSLNEEGQVENTAGESGEGGKADSNTSVAGVGKPILNKVPADKTANGGQEYTRVVFEMTFNQKLPGAALLSGALMHNIYNDTILKAKFKERSAEAVYIDAVGNIVLNDGLVVLPAAANPTYWARPIEQVGFFSDIQLWQYNPFTVAFMDTYPAIYQGAEAPSSVNEKKDKNKYVLSSDHMFTDEAVVLPLKDGYKRRFAVSPSTFLVKKFKVDGIAEPQNDLVVNLAIGLKVDNKEIVTSSFTGSIPYKLKNLVTQEGDSVFPYLTSQVTDPEGQEAFDTNYVNYRSSILIAKNMYAYIIGEHDKDNNNVTSAKGVSAGGSSTGRLREGFLFNNVTMPVLTGITNGTEFDKSNAKSDLLKAGGDANVFEKWIINFSKWLSVVSKNSINILSVSNPDEVSLLKTLYGLFIDYGYYIVFISIMVLVVIFLREGDFMAAVLKGFLILGLLFSALFVIPLAVPGITGLTSSPLSKSTVLNSLMTKLEITEKVHSVEPAGTSGLSVKLYNMSPKQAKEINDEYFYDDVNYLTNKFSINDNLGMYVQGTEIRLDLYTFWRFDPLIVATSDNVKDPLRTHSVPQIYHSDHSTSTYIADNQSAKDDMKYNNDLVDYYMPFNLLENGLMRTLNTYLTYYNPPQSIVRYPDGLVKSSYILSTYMKSLAFLAAEPSVAETIASAETPEDYGHLGLDELEVKVVNEKFYPYGDILNLQTWVDTEWTDLPETYANALWTQTMLKSGYYDPGTGIEKRVALADRVNRKAYDMILHMKDTNGLVSDETMIKIVALYATFEWNKEISYISNNTYPKTPSLNEISASELLSSVVLGESRQYLFYDTSLISNVFNDEGLVGVVATDISLLALVVYSILLSWIIPILLVGLLGYAVYLILTNKSMMPALIFTFKLVSLAVVMNLLLLIILKTYKIYNNIYLLTLLLAALMGVFLWLMYRVVFKRKDRMASSWQSRHLRSMAGYGRNGNEQQYPNEQSPRQMRDYLEESGGINERRRSQTSRYDD